MSIVVYNTKTGRKEPLIPLEDNHLRMYVCGITAYDYCHIGHARSALVFDLIVRYLRHRGFTVTYVRNFTDIDDKIIRRAQEQHTSCEELSQRFIRFFHEDMAALGVLPPDIEPKATEHIPEIIEMIQRLIERGYAYQAGGDVYYRVSRFAGYGVLSGRNLEEMQAGARIEINDRKEHPMDFALWKESKPGEPTWESPWGPGRPGWHIECSAMSRKYLGDSFDIHGGGKDLIFPHHENEIAQSEGATGMPFARYWIHHGFVTIKDEKMSKSLGNFLTIREVLDRFPAEALRLFVFSTHYRNPLDYSDDALTDALAGLDRLYACLAETARLPESGAAGQPDRVGKKDRQKLSTLDERFQQAMDNDFNSALALGHLFEAVKILNKIRQTLPKTPATPDLTLLHQAAGRIRSLAGILGLLQQEPLSYVQAKKERFLADQGLNAEEIAARIEERDQARANRDWARADAIRDALLEKGIELQDGPTGTSWHIHGPANR